VGAEASPDPVCFGQQVAATVAGAVFYAETGAEERQTIH
jgi:hypothetical protein